MMRRWMAAAGLALLLVAGCSQTPTGLVKGVPAPDFVLTDTQGQTWQLSQLKGQVVFINFWATWCPPCLRELPAMQRLYAMMPKDRFKMLALLNNDKLSLGEFIAGQKGYTMPVLDDSDNRVGTQYRLTGLPETFIVDKEGILREHFIGPEPWDEKGFVEMIMGYINAPGSGVK